MKPRDIIKAARDLHMSFDDLSQPDAGALRFLDGYQGQLMGEALQRYPSLWSETQVVSLPLGDFAAGIALDTPFFIDDIFQTINGDDWPLREVPYEHRFDNGLPARYCWKVNNKLYLSVNANLWSEVESITIRFSKRPTALAALSDDLQLPDTAEMTLRYAVAEFWASRGTQRQDVEPPSSRQFESKHIEAKSLFLDQLWLLRSSAPRFIRDVGD